MKRLFPFLIILLLVTGCKKNHGPVISSLACSPETRSAGTLFTLTATASDEDQDELTYLWDAGKGSFTTLTNTNVVQWQSPVTGSGETFTVSVTVSDGENSVTREIKLVLGEPELGSVQGYLNYTNFNIPIPEATVTVGDHTTTTNTDGYFLISGIPAGPYTLTACKQDFSSATSLVTIIKDSTVTLSVRTTSATSTTKLSGILTDSDGQPVGNARIVVLNPDESESSLASTTTNAGYYKLWFIPFGDRTIVATKSETESVRFQELKTTITCQELEFQVNLTMQKVLLTGQFTDPRDHHVYPYKTIGNVTWMTENLAYLPEVSPSAQSSYAAAYYYVYDYQGTETSAAIATSNYKQYGVLYNWVAASAACPSGWHLPSSVAWDALASPDDPESASKIKATSGWAEHGNGDNSTGFTAMPAGNVQASGVFSGMNSYAYFWTSSINSGAKSCRLLTYSSDQVYSLSSADKLGYSVRCVKDD